MGFLATILPWIQIALSILLVGAILLQQSGAGVGGAFGGGGDSAGFHKRRGMEKVLLQATVILGVLFALSAFAALLI